MLTFNPAASIFGRLYGLVDWQDAGHFRLSYRFVGLPAVEYSSNVNQWKLKQMLPDFILVAIVFIYVVFTAHSTWSNWSIERKSRWRRTSKGRGKVAYEPADDGGEGEDELEEDKATDAREKKEQAGTKLLVAAPSPPLLSLSLSLSLSLIDLSLLQRKRLEEEIQGLLKCSFQAQNLPDPCPL